MVKGKYENNKTQKKSGLSKPPAQAPLKYHLAVPYFLRKLKYM